MKFVRTSGSARHDRAAPRLGIGPMTPELIEAVFRFSAQAGVPLSLVASRSQVDADGGYVAGWTTAEFVDFVRRQRVKHPRAAVLLCRDHCGPGFGAEDDPASIRRTIHEDLTLGFDAIHFDYSRLDAPREVQLEECEKAIRYALSLRPDVQLEVGADDTNEFRKPGKRIAELREEIEFFQSFCDPVYYVPHTGSLVRETGQAGAFEVDWAPRACRTIHEHRMLVKEHNADYLGGREIALRRGHVDAMNVAPQFGIVQTALMLQRSLCYGIPARSFIEQVYEGGRWRKWLLAETPASPLHCAHIAGHYHQAAPAYKELYARLAEEEDIRETIIRSHLRVLGHYGRRIHALDEDASRGREAVGI